MKADVPELSMAHFFGQPTGPTNLLTRRDQSLVTIFFDPTHRCLYIRVCVFYEFLQSFEPDHQISGHNPWIDPTHGQLYGVLNMLKEPIKLFTTISFIYFLMERQH